MIIVLTKTRHIEKINKFLEQNKINFEIYTVKTIPDFMSSEYNLGVSYCYPRLVTEPLLSLPKLGFVNYHPAPLPEYKGHDPYSRAVAKRVMKWGVSVHKMNEKYDDGEIIQVDSFDLNEPPFREELGTLAHYFSFKLFKKTIIPFSKGNLNEQT